jgi:DNA polymerase I-like protein with 3'-5' exonuclease and polymerase domains
MKRKVNHDRSDGLTGILFEPRSDWKCPVSFPDLSGEKYLGIDIESRDDELTKMGPGFIRGDANVVGISVSTTNRSWYYPIAHLGGGNHNEPHNVINYFRDLLRVEDRFIVGANLQYELEGLDSKEISLRGRLIDIQIAEAIIDEEQPSGYSLEAIARRRLGEGKDETLLKEANAAYGFINSKSNLWKLPAKYVGPYAEFDSHSVLRIWDEQRKELEKQDLLEIFQLESEVLPLLWKMRKQGVPVDVEGASRLSKELHVKQSELELSLMKECGFWVNCNSGPDIQKVFMKLGLKYPMTAPTERFPSGQASFTGDFLDSFAHPIVAKIAEIRELESMRSKFIDEWILKYNVKGRIHPQWKQLASDDGGTRTGRMACSNPNAQQVPAGKYRTTGKANEFGKAIRALFISDSGNWAKFDYKQQEPRILTHFANLCKYTGAPLAAMAYSTNKEMDFYQYIVESAGIDRRVAKDMYLGLCYGMGINKLCAKLGKPRDEGERIINDFNTRVPFIKEISEGCERSAQQRGYIRTLLGRRRHFNKWEPIDGYKRRTENGEIITACSLEEAEQRWPKVRLVRADTRKALNALIQGSAADMVKASLLKVYKETGNVPYLAVHDELDYPVESEEHAKTYLQMIETSVEMTVPIYADLDYGKSWK